MQHKWMSSNEWTLASNIFPFWKRTKRPFLPLPDLVQWLVIKNISSKVRVCVFYMSTLQKKICDSITK